MAWSPNARGFILIADLWVPAALALRASYLNSIVVAQVQSANEVKQVFRAELERRNTDATVIYLLATGRMKHKALMLEEEQQFFDR